MSLLNEYINKRLSVPDLEAELLGLIGRYNQQRGTFLFVYAAAIGKQIPGVQLEQSDFYTIYDLLARRSDVKTLDVYLETPGGSGEAAEEIVRFLRSKFDSVSFVVSGEAKSAGTIMVLSGDEILMTATGSLGPIDAQMKVGRSVISAHDYMEWVNNKRQEAGERGALNPFDATMVAQITPGELGGVHHSLQFAQDLVSQWLVKYKFRDWNATQTRGLPVDEAMKVRRAKEIARTLSDHSKWRSHGRSLKSDDLEGIGLRVTKVDKDPNLAETVYRIQTVCRMLFEFSTTFKIFATCDTKIFRLATPVGAPMPFPQAAAPDAVEFQVKCGQCGKVYNIYAKLVQNPRIDEQFKARGKQPFPKNARIVCDCGFEIDLAGAKNEIEMQTGKKLILEQGCSLGRS